MNVSFILTRSQFTIEQQAATLDHNPGSTSLFYCTERIHPVLDSTNTVNLQ